jgi:hypothetical protein
MLGLLLASNRSEPSATYEPVTAAAPQTAALDWVERFPADGPALVYRVKEIRVEPDGWEAELAIENRTDRRYEIPAATDPTSRVFGVMMFASGELEDLQTRSRTGDYPTVRPARTVVPALPLLLLPGDVWSGTIAAPGSLPGGKWLRVVFGPLTVVGDVPKDVPTDVIWITDHAHRLRGAP